MYTTKNNERILPQSHRVLITGASGFIGSHLCGELLRRGHEVHAVSRSRPVVFGERLIWHPVDLTDERSTRKTIAGIGADLIFHLCSHAQGERELPFVLPTFRNEVQTTINVLTSAVETGCNRLVMAGSLEEPAPGEVPASPYAAAKASSRQYASMFHRLYGLPVVQTRIFMTYGPGQSQKKLIMHCIKTLRQGGRLAIASPNRKVDWIYVDDVVCGLLAVATTPGLEGKSVDLGSGEVVTIRDLVINLRQLINPNAVVEFGSSPWNDVEMVRRADATTTRTLTGWRCIVPLGEGLARTVAHFSDEAVPNSSTSAAD